MIKESVQIDHDVDVVYLSADKSVVEKIDGHPMSIYILCCKTGKTEIETSFIPHPISLSQSEAIFLAFPRGPWQLINKLNKNSQVFVLRLSLQKLHELISASFNPGEMNRQDNFNLQDLMKVIPVSPSLVNIFDQLLYNSLQPPFDHIFLKAKFLELFSVLMSASFSKSMEACPVVLNREVELKLQEARRKIIENLETTPDPDALAFELEIPRTTLKEGFKYIYGKSLHQFHSDYKMESALSMIESGNFLVKEVAYKVGYQNPSHFIAAFKRKYGVTPKQYLKKMTNSNV